MIAEQPPQAPARRRLPKWAPQAAGYTLSAACLFWVLHGYDFTELRSHIGSLDWKWVALGVALDLTVYVVHGWRWVTLLRPVKRLPFWRTVQSIYIGLFANEVLPLRTGELIRCYLLAHWNGVHLSVSIASAAVERLIDGFWMVGFFLITARYVKGLPKGLVDLVQVVGVLLLLAAGVLLFVVVHKHKAHAAIRESRWAATLRHIVEGIHLMGQFRILARVVWLSLLYLVLQMLSYWALLRGDNFDLSLWIASAVLIIVRFVTVIPNAPGNLGVFQAACVIALKLFDVEVSTARTFSMVLFFFLTVPLLLGGAVATALTGLNLKEIRNRAQEGVKTAHENPPSELGAEP